VALNNGSGDHEPALGNSDDLANLGDIAGLGDLGGEFASGLDLGGDDDSGGDAGSAVGDDTTPAGSFAFRDGLRSRGFELPDELDDDKLVEQFETWSERAQRFEELTGNNSPEQVQELLRLGREFEQNREAFAEFQRSRLQQLAPKQSAPQAQAPAADAATVEMWKQACKWDEENQVYVPKVAGFEGAAHGLNQQLMQSRQNLERFAQSPDDFVRERAQAIIAQEVERRLGEFRDQVMPDLQQWQEYQRKQAIDSFVAPVDSELRTRGPDGSITLTPKGEAFERAFDSAPQGLSLQDQLKWALNGANEWAAKNPQTPSTQFRLKRGTAATPAAAPAQPAAPVATEPPTDPKKRFIDRGRHGSRGPNGDRSGTVTASDRSGLPQHNRLPSFAQMYAEAKGRGG